MTIPETHIDASAWAEWHAVHAPWCDPTRCRSHDMRLNGPDLVNGKPAGPMAALTVPGVAAIFAREQDERAARFRALVDGLLAKAPPRAHIADDETAARDAGSGPWQAFTLLGEDGVWSP